MRRFGFIAAAVCGLSLLAASAQADDRAPVRLLDNAQVAAGATTSVDVTPVRVGVGWRGTGYYPGWGRPYYGGGYRGGYYGGYNNYYRGGYGNYYRPYGGYYGNGYYNAYRPYYGGGYWRY
jgi:hypothetical protein